MERFRDNSPTWKGSPDLHVPGADDGIRTRDPSPWQSEFGHFADLRSSPERAFDVRFCVVRTGLARTRWMRTLGVLLGFLLHFPRFAPLIEWTVNSVVVMAKGVIITQ